MKRFMCVFFAAIMFLGFAGSFVGCKEEGGSLPAETEKIIPQVKEPITPMDPPPVERQLQGEQEGGGDVSHDNLR